MFMLKVSLEALGASVLDVSELVGTQQRDKHVDADADGARDIEQGDQQDQTRLSRKP
jgi:hypothetical protein